MLQRVLDVFEDDVLLQEYDEPTYRMDPNAEQNPLLKTGMACAELEGMIEVEVSRRVDDVIHKPLAEMMTATIPRVTSKSFQDQSKTRLVMGSVLGNALARFIERGHLDNLISERLTRNVDSEDTIQVMTINLLGNREFMAPVARFVKRNTRKY